MKESVVRILGAGPTGALLAIFLHKRGFANIELYEARQDPRAQPHAAGRSINLALADRGIHALREAGVLDELKVALLPMKGRMIHSLDGSTTFQRYGQRPNEQNYSISRHRLNQALIGIASRLDGVHMFFEHRFEGADFVRATATLLDTANERRVSIPMQPLIATDGAGSPMRRALQAAHLIDAKETDLEHGYKELTIPADAAGGYRMAPDALHIWPRGNAMLIALPNEDGSFTATLFLAKHGAPSFESLNEAHAIDEFLTRLFPDARRLMPDCTAEFQSHPVGFLGSVAAWPWHHSGAVALLGDSAHAMVPFHGQGMNCCFEDCLEFDAIIGAQHTWQTAFARFEEARKPDTDAISAMALENYLEMRERVADPKFQLQQTLSFELERRHPDRFIPRYSMVMFHHEIPYRTALARGSTQAALLSELTAGAATSTLSDIDFELAGREISSRLPAI